MSLLTLWTDWGTAIQWVFGAIGGWSAAVGQYRLRAQANRLTAGQQALTLVAASQAREAALTTSYRHVVALEATARQHAVASAVLLETVYEQAIGARLRAHELERQTGLPVTDFVPLPPFPVLDIPPPAASDGMLATGDQAVSPADPGAEHTHR